MFLSSNESAVWPEPIDPSRWDPRYRHKATDTSRSEGSSGDASEVTTNKSYHLIESTARYPRKRGATACQLCRVRKTKCDNARPACGFCAQHKAKCVYGSSSEARLPFDAASEEILSRLSAIQSLLSHGNAVPPTAAGSAAGAAARYDQTYSIAGTHRGVDLKTASASTSASDILWRREYPASTLSATRCETLLQWPVFEDVVSAKVSNTKSFLLDCSSDRDEMVDLAASGDRLPSTSEQENASEDLTEKHQVHGANFVNLCYVFLSTIHRRNPILDGDRLMESAHHVMAHGLRWDARTCLVLLASALAHCGSSCSLDGVAASGRVELTAAGIEDELTPEAYYTEAKKRIGFLQSSITDIQCLLLASMYEKATLNIIKAWDYIKDACSRLQTYLSSRRRVGHEQQAHHLEPRIFWSCMKAESDLVAELPLQPSGIENFEYPYPFPSPPQSLAKATGLRSPSSGSVDSSGSNPRQIEEEESWFFYTADISFRRILNHHLKVLYTEAGAGWMENINLAFAQFTECERQIEVWYHHLPSVIRFSLEGHPDNELSVFLKGRFQGWRELVRRPFLYYVLHHGGDEPVDPQMMALATECLGICACLINHYFPQGRHGGTWFISRRTFTCALLILAAVFANRQDLQPPDDWPTVLQMAIDMLKKWETAASDIARMRVVLTKLVHEARQKTGIGPTWR